MKKKKFPVFILCSLLTLTNIQTPWAFSDEALDDPVFSDESVDDPVFPVELPDDPAFSDEITPDVRSRGLGDVYKRQLQIYLLPEIPFRSLLTVDLQTLFSKNGFPKTLIQIATGFSLTKKSPCAQKSVCLPCQSIPWKASNIFII